MRNLTPTSIFAFAFLLSTATPQVMKAQDEEKKSLEERVSYSYGVSIARQLKSLGMDLDKAVLKKAIDDVFEDKELEMTPAQIEAATNEARRFVAERDVEEGPAKENLEAGQKFLAENAKKEGVTTTDSGLQYEVLEKGDGEKPTGAANRVTVHYTGTLLDGEKFDSSVDRGEPATFGLNQVIPGWTEGVQLMPEGAKYKFYIPYHLAYGPSGRPGSIPPFAMLTFEIELIETGN